MKILYLLTLIACLLNLNLTAQSNKNYIHNIVLELNSTKQLLNGDIDNDGDEDLIELYNSKIAWFENEQNFYPYHHSIIISDSLQISQIAIGDIDNDGDLDIATVGNRYYAIFTNDGYGNFEENIFYEDNNNYTAEFIALGDLDSDNRIDILVSGTMLSSISWFKNQGNSPFIQKSSIHKSRKINQEGVTIQSLYLIDFDKNGTNDIILNNDRIKENKVWFSNDGNAWFTEMPFITDSKKIGQFLIVDIDSDGFYDAVGESVEGLACFYNDGSNSFDDSDTLGSHIIGQVKASGDFNGDNLADLVFSSENERLLLVYLNKGDQTFAISDTLLDEYPVYVRTILPLDFDQDGDKDIISANGWEDAVYMFENNGAGNFELKQYIHENQRERLSFSMIDMDGDGDKDFITSSASYYDKLKGVHIINNNGGNSFGFPVLIADLRTSTIKAIDLNNDNICDIICASFDYLYWLKNNDKNEFTKPIIIDSTFGWFTQMSTADLDGNTFQDLLIQDYNSDGYESLFWYANDSGMFNANKKLIVPDSVALFHHDDMNNNGLPDLLIGHKEGTFYLYSNTGNVDFDLHLIASERGQKAISSTDLNNDGKQDILSFYFDYASDEYRFGWYENLGENNFDQVKVLHNEFSSFDFKYVNKINTADLNLDGYIDIILTSQNDGYIFYNFGDGTFSNAEIFFGNDGLATGDMDEDNDPDFIFSKDGWYSLSWYENFFNSVQSFNQSICLGDSLMFFDEWLFEAGDYTKTFNNQNGGLDEVHLNLQVLDDFPSSIDLQGSLKCFESEVLLYSIESEELTEFYWNADNGEIISLVNQTNAEIKWSQSGIQTLEIFAVKPKSGCASSSKYAVEVETITPDKINIYPNPANESFAVTPTTDALQVEIVDAAGRTVIITTNEKPIDVSSLAAGNYIVLFNDQNGNKFGWKKLIID